MSESRQLAAIMFTDIVGYTALMGEDERKAFKLLDKNREIQRPIIEQFKGKWIKEIGDGILASFHTVSDAVFCAIGIQQACEKIPDLKLRIGIHLGEVIFQNHDVFGDGVNIASRLQALAPIGGILVSESVYKNISNKKEIITEFIGEEVLKNVKEPVKIYEVNVGKSENRQVDGLETLKKKIVTVSGKKKKIFFGVGLLFLATLLTYYLFVSVFFPGKKNTLEKSIAVLYFDNMSGDPAQDYFSDGITEEIITRLSFLKDLRVISRTSVFSYKGKGKNIKEIAKELNCSTILEGSVRKSGNKISITARLIDANTDKYLWSDIFDRELNDIFEIQSSVAETIADKFAVLISPETQIQISHQPTRNMVAYDLYLKAKSVAFKDAGLGIGNSYFNRDQARTLLKKAIKLDPAFSEALALLSRTFLEGSDYGEGPNMLDSATEYAQKAIEYNPAVIEGHMALALVSEARNPKEALPFYVAIYKIDPSVGLLALGDYYIRRADFVEAMKFFDQKIRHEPNKVEGYIRKVESYVLLGQKDSAFKYINKSKLLDPNHRDILEWELFYYDFNGEPDEIKKIGKLFYNDDSLGFNKQIAIAYLYKRDWIHAEEYYKKTNYRDMDWGLVLWKTGRRDSAMKVIQRAIDYRLKFAPFTWDLSRAYALKNDPKTSIYYLNKGLDEGVYYYYWIKNDPFWDEIRGTPEFKKVESDFYKKNDEMLRQIHENEKREVVPDLSRS
jgi:adenylate cyclase